MDMPIDSAIVALKKYGTSAIIAYNEIKDTNKALATVKRKALALGLLEVLPSRVNENTARDMAIAKAAKVTRGSPIF